MSAPSNRKVYAFIAAFAALWIWFQLPSSEPEAEVALAATDNSPEAMRVRREAARVETLKREAEARERYKTAAPDIARQARNALTLKDYPEVIRVVEPWLAVADAETKGMHQAAVDAIAKAKAEEAARIAAEKERVEAAHRALVARIGEMPVASAWDGAYYEVERYLQKIAHDPDSIDMDACSKPLEKDVGWVVRCDYRGKNAFGALIRKSGVFVIKHGEVVDAADL